MTQARVKMRQNIKVMIKHWHLEKRWQQKPQGTEWKLKRSGSERRRKEEKNHSPACGCRAMASCECLSKHEANLFSLTRNVKACKLRSAKELKLICYSLYAHTNCVCVCVHVHTETFYIERSISEVASTNKF